MIPRKHSHYFRDVRHLSEVDVYRVLALFNVTDQAIGHAVKKLLVAGGRGAGKNIGRDIAEAVDTLQRWQEMRAEDLEQHAERLVACLDGCACCGPVAAPGGPLAAPGALSQG
jgi:hypothetical protein